ncbi:hypothetical protein PPN31119_03239 [Pandoraea pnomenusa]|uniref:Uncharacterized protein n=1 Tax=Pandoraea pnomenusa TaxID=93220 RepID=A0ABY6WM88_9BURK|nr:hypothetical protein [Pandoraea pnomenusa]VVE69298.1 hypothetical protein PPN31119_03239 [Pandoraea pnomenusa]
MSPYEPRPEGLNTQPAPPSVVETLRKPLKAYQAYDGNDCWSIQFATNSATARREAAGEAGCDFEDIEWCRRAPSLDEYAPGPVPARALIEIGWWFECGCCGRRVHSDMLQDIDDEELDAGDYTITTRGTWAFCSPSCMAMFDEERRSTARAEAAAIEAASLRFPFGDKFFPYVGGCADAREAEVSFSFPGGTGHANWKVGETSVSVRMCDLDAWKAITGQATEENQNA